MDGYDLVTSDDKRLGHVVGTEGDNVIIEHGHLRKSRHAVPQTFVEVHEDEHIVRTTLSKQLIEDSPKLDDDGVDEAEIAAYYGLAGGDSTAPATEGLGALNPDDPATLNPGTIAAEQERAEIRRGMEGGDTYGSPGRQVIPPSPHEVGGREYEER
jgi:hypothetical protein